jgi:hypothetical protein
MRKYEAAVRNHLIDGEDARQAVKGSLVPSPLP